MSKRCKVHLVSYNLFTTNLRHDIEVHHGFSERVCIGPEVGDQTQHGSVEGAINLLEGGTTRVVHVDNRDVAKEPKEMNKWMSSLRCR